MKVVKILSIIRCSRSRKIIRMKMILMIAWITIKKIRFKLNSKTIKRMIMMKTNRRIKMNRKMKRCRSIKKIWKKYKRIWMKSMKSW